MTRAELVASMAEKAGLTKKDADAALKAFMESVTETLVKGEKIQLVGFGTFEVVERPARESRNPKTGEKMFVESSRSAKVKFSKALKDQINA